MSRDRIPAVAVVAPPREAAVGRARTDAPGVERAATATAADWVALLRPRQWLKNAFVLAPLLFSTRLTDPVSAGRGTAAAALFCLLASGIYCWNDVADRVADRAHPAKRRRPVAAGRIAPQAARAAALALVLVSTVGAFAVSPALATIFVVYVALNALYSRGLKDVVLLDVFVVAAFFVLRLLAGVAAIGVHPSVWLLLCGGLLSLYLAFAKRRNELTTLGDDCARHRSVLGQYDTAFLDQVSTMLLAVTVVSYVMYTLSSETAAAVGSETLSYSTVFVLYGTVRYLWLARGDHGGNPAETLLTDRPLLAAVASWLLYCGWAIYRPF